MTMGAITRLQVGMSWVTAAVLMLGLDGAFGPAVARKAPALILGAPRLIGGDTIAVPVQLRGATLAPIAGLDFTLRYDPIRLTLDEKGVVGGRAVRKAHAELASRDVPDEGRLEVMVLPEFQPNFATLQGRPVAIVYLRVRGAAPAQLGRWLRRRVKLERVVLADSQGRELRPGIVRRKGQR
jgi:hypothetical protein